MNVTTRKSLLACILLTLSGCESSGLKGWTERLATGTQMYSQDQAVTLVKPFSMRMERAYWTDEFGKPGFDSVPPGMRDQFRARPVGKFLVVDLSLTNLGEKPVNWSSDQPPLFTLRNSKGVEYASVGQDINMHDLTGTIALGQTSPINPGMSLKGKKLFDVPKDDYLMDVWLGRMQGLGFVKAQRIFTWGLTPTGE